MASVQRAEFNKTLGSEKNKIVLDDYIQLESFLMGSTVLHLPEWKMVLQEGWFSFASFKPLKERGGDSLRERGKRQLGCQQDYQDVSGRSIIVRSPSEIWECVLQSPIWDLTLG